MAFDIHYSEEKNQLLKATRGVSFDDAIIAISNGALIDDIAHPNKKYVHQRIYVIKINTYVYAVPYVINPKTNDIFLKTVYPSRVLMHKYARRGAL